MNLHPRFTNLAPEAEPFAHVPLAADEPVEPPSGALLDCVDSRAAGHGVLLAAVHGVDQFGPPRAGADPVRVGTVAKPNAESSSSAPRLTLPVLVRPHLGRASLTCRARRASSASLSRSLLCSRQVAMSSIRYIARILPVETLSPTSAKTPFRGEGRLPCLAFALQQNYPIRRAHCHVSYKYGIFQRTGAMLDRPRDGSCGSSRVHGKLAAPRAPNRDRAVRRRPASSRGAGAPASGGRSGWRSVSPPAA